MISAVDIAVVIPVGPSATACRWLAEATDSVGAQTTEPGAVILVDDMHSGHAGECAMAKLSLPVLMNWWRLGVGGSFAAGVAWAHTACRYALMLGADDWLEPTAIADAVHTINARPRERAYYWYRVRYADGRGDQAEPCNAAIVSRELWRWSGGFAPETGVGAPDAALISTLMVHDPEALIPINDNGTPPYNVRIHDEQDTAVRGPWQGAILAARHVLTETFRPAEWGRY